MHRAPTCIKNKEFDTFASLTHKHSGRNIQTVMKTAWMLHLAKFNEKKSDEKKMLLTKV
jgi:hypothetical protein